jgi:putative membrane protein
MKSLLVAASACALLIAAPAWAQNAPTGAQSLSQQDKSFIQEAGAGNLAEAELGQLAEQKAANPGVKVFGRWMYADHGLVANKWLAAILQEHHESFQPTLTAEQKQMRQKLEGVSGTQFDQQYAEMMVQDHEKTIPVFEREAKEGHNPLIKRYAGDLIPVLQQHLAGAKELAGGSGMAAGQGTSATQRSGTSSPQR